MSSEGCTADSLVGVSKSKIPVELENGKAWQASSKPWDCDFYLHQSALPGTWTASMQRWLRYVRLMGRGGCQKWKNIYRFF